MGVEDGFKLAFLSDSGWTYWWICCTCATVESFLIRGVVSRSLVAVMDRVLYNLCHSACGEDAGVMYKL